MSRKSGSNNIVFTVEQLDVPAALQLIGEEEGEKADFAQTARFVAWQPIPFRLN